MTAFAQRLDVAVVGRHDERDVRRLRVADKRGQKTVVRAQHGAGARVVHRMPGDVRLEKLVERQIVRAREAKQVLGRARRRNDGNVGIAILNRLAREILQEGLVVLKVCNCRDGLRRRQGHHRRHGLEPPIRQFVRRLNEIGVGELHAPPALLQFKEEVVARDDLPKFLAGETLAMTANRLGAVDAREHRRLPGRGLRDARDAQAGVNRLRVPRQETPQRRTDLRIQGILRRGLPDADPVNE